MTEAAMKVIFWTSLFLAAYAYFGYPALLYALSGLMPFRPGRYGTYTPRVSLLISAYNEEASIGQRIENALALDYPPGRLEVIVASNGSTDSTDAIAGGYARRGAAGVEGAAWWGDGGGVRLFSYREAGKTRAQNLTIPQAKGEIVVLSDANTHYGKDALRKLVRHFADDRVGLVCGRLSYGDSPEAMVGKGERLYWNYDVAVKTLESRMGACLVANGSIVAFRKSLYEPIDEDLPEDFVLPVRMLAKGYMNVFEPEALAFEKTAGKGKEEFERKKRIITQGSRAFLSMLGEVCLKRPLVALELVSHKFLRWFAGAFIAVAFLSSLLLLKERFYLAFFVSMSAFYLAALAGWFLERAGMRIKALYVPYYFCLVNAAAIAGVGGMLSGKRLPAWHKAESTRS